MFVVVGTSDGDRGETLDRRAHQRAQVHFRATTQHIHQAAASTSQEAEAVRVAHSGGQERVQQADQAHGRRLGRAGCWRELATRAPLSRKAAHTRRHTRHSDHRTQDSRRQSKLEIYTIVGLNHNPVIDLLFCYCCCCCC